MRVRGLERVRVRVRCEWGDAAMIVVGALPVVYVELTTCSVFPPRRAA